MAFGNGMGGRPGGLGGSLFQQMAGGGMGGRPGTAGGGFPGSMAQGFANHNGASSSSSPPSKRFRAGSGLGTNTSQRADLIPQGTVVRVIGLQRQQEHNGKTGVVEPTDQSDESKGRYKIRLVDDVEDKVLHLRPDNLSLEVAACKLKNITSKPELNGVRGATVRTYNAEKNRYVIDVPTVMPPSGATGSQAMMLAPTCVVLPNGTRVQLFGLNKAELIGLWGTVLSFDDGEDKYIVQIGPERTLKVGMDKCRASGGGSPITDSGP